MSPLSESALAKLKAALADINTASAKTASINAEAFDLLEATPVALAGVTFSDVAHVVTSINVDWDPKDHPRDPHTGEFTKAPGGYIFGKTKSAKFMSQSINMELDMAPGDVVWRTPAKNIVVSHADGTHTLYSWLPAKKSYGEAKAIPVGNKALAQGLDSGKYIKVAENPGTLVPAKSKAEAAKMVENPADGPLKEEQVPAPQKLTPQDVPVAKIESDDDFDAKIEAEAKIYAMQPTGMEATSKSGVKWTKIGDNQWGQSDLPLGKGVLTDEGLAYYFNNEEDNETNAAPSIITEYKDGSALLIHPASGVSYALHTGDKVYENPQDKGGLIIQTVDDDGNGITHWFNSKGKLSLNVAMGWKDGQPDIPWPVIWPATGAEEPPEFPTPAEPVKDGSAWDIPKPVLKDGKKTFTAKQYADYQAATKGHPMFPDQKGNTVLSGSWVEFEGKPYQVWASPYPGFQLTVYRWVSTKQKASNLEKEGLLKMSDDMKVIPDPTGKPYGHETLVAAPTKIKPAQHGNLMSQAVVGPIPNTATAHKKYVAEQKGKLLTIKESDSTPGGMMAVKGGMLFSGDWIELDGKPFQIHSSPNPGNVALSKWVSTKMQPSNNTYDFPSETISVASPVKIEDPTGKPYVPLAESPAKVGVDPLLKETQATPLSADKADLIPQFPEGTIVTLAAPLTGNLSGYKRVGVSWQNVGLNLTITDANLVTKVKESSSATLVPTTADDYDEVLNDDRFKPVSRVLTVGGNDYVLQGETWYPKGKNAIQVGPITAGAIKAKLAEINDIEQKVKDLKPGEEFSTTSASGVLTEYGTIDGENVFNVATGKKTTKDMVVKALHTAHAGTFTYAFTPKSADPEKQVSVSVAAGAEKFFSVSKKYDTDMFTHPVSGNTYVLGGFNQKVYQSLSNPDWFHIESSTSAVEFDGDGAATDVSPGKAISPILWKQIYPAATDQSDPWALPPEQGANTTAAHPNVFVHPVSGAVFDLQPGDVVYKHKGTDNAYIIERPGAALPIFFFNQYGKLYKPKEKQKNLDTAYEPVDDWPGKPAAVDAPEAPSEDTSDHPDTIPATVSLIEGAVPGDKVVLHKEVGDDSTWVKHESGQWQHEVKKNSFVPTTSVKGWAVITSASFVPHDGVQHKKQPTGVPATPDMIDGAVPGDKLLLVNQQGDQPWVKLEKSKWSGANDWMHETSGGYTDSNSMKAWVGPNHHPAIKSTTFFPNNTVLSEPDKDKAPWGGTPSPAGSTTPKKKPAAKKVSKEEIDNLPHSYVTANKTFDLKPGQWVGKVTYGDKEYLFLGDYSGGSAFSPDGATISTGDPSYWINNQQTPKQLLKQVTDDGDLLAYYPLSKSELDLSAYPPSQNFITAENTPAEAVENYMDTQTANNWGGDGIITYWSSNTPSYYDTYAKFGGANYQSLTNEQKLELFIGYKDRAGQMLSEIQNFQNSDAWKTVPKADKTKITKYAKGAEVAHRIGLLAEAYINGAADNEWYANEWANLQPVFDKPGTHIGASTPVGSTLPVQEAQSLFNVAEAQRVFKESIKNLGFDPYNATTADYDAYAKSKGFQYLAAMSEDDQKAWVLADLGDPAITSMAKKKILDKAKMAKASAEVATLAASLHKPDPDTYPVASVSGVFEKGMLKSSYQIGDTKLTNVGSDTWQVDDVVGSDLTDAAVTELVNNAVVSGVPFTESDTLAYGPGTVVENVHKVEKKYGLTEQGLTIGSAGTLQLREIAVQQGLASITADYMSATDLRRWLVVDAAGDQIAKWKLETDAYGSPPNAATHPGNPATPAGAAAHKALANWLAAQPWGPEYLDGSNYPDNLPGGDFASYSDQVYHWADAGVPNVNWSYLHPGVRDFWNGYQTSPSGKALKPINVTDEVWTLAHADSDSDLNSLFDANLLSKTTAQLDAAISGNAAFIAAGISGLNLGALPLRLKRLLVWSIPNDQYMPLVSKAVGARLSAGEFFADETPVWIAPNGTKYPISPGSKVFKDSANGYIITNPDQSQGWYVNGTKAPAQANYYTLNNVKGDYTQNGYTLLFQMPDLLTWEAAKGQNPDLSEDFWHESEKIEEGTSTKFQSAVTGPVLTMELKNSDLLQSNYPHLYAQQKSLPENIRQAVWAAVQGNSKPMLDVLEFKASKGHFASMQAKGLYDSSHAWVQPLSLGQVSATDIKDKWTAEAKQEYVSFYGLKSADDIAAHLDRLIHPDFEPAVSKALPSEKDITLGWVKSKSKGMHSGEIWADQDGNEWMSKAFPNDPNSKARVDAEVVANKIGSLYGFAAPTVYTTNVYQKSKKDPHGENYKYAYLQHLKPADKDFTTVAPGDLTQNQLGQAMSEHVIDWITSNHDTHNGNLMIDPKGKVFGIDKGQAWRFFPDDKLAVGYQASNPEPVWYDQFYKALQNGQIPKETADAVTKQVLRTAQRISKDKDDEFRALLEQAFQNRTFWPAEYPTREQFIDAVVERKHNTFDQFVALYKGIYAKSPYEWDIDTDNLNPPALDKHTFIAPSQDYAEEVKKSQGFGKALFFNTDALDDGHLLLSTAKASDGSLMLTGEAKVTKKGDKALSAWLSSQKVDHQANASFTSSKPAVVQALDWEDPGYMPMNNLWFSALVDASKTVSHHNVEGDKNYNAVTLSNAEKTRVAMEKAKTWLTDWKAKHPGEPAVSDGTVPGMSDGFKFQTMEQQDAWEGMLDTYLGYYQKIEEAKGTDNKISPYFTEVLYQPTKKALDELKAKLNAGKPASPKDAPLGTVVANASGNAQYTKIADNKWSVSGSLGQMMDTTYADDAFVAVWESLTLIKVPEDPSKIENAPVGAMVEYNGKTYKKLADNEWNSSVNTEVPTGWNDMPIGSTVISAMKKKYTKTGIDEWTLQGPALQNSTKTFSKLKMGDFAAFDFDMDSLPPKVDGDTLDDAALKEAYEAAQAASHEDDTETTVKVGTKVLKVIYRKSAMKNVNFNSETGDLELKGGEFSAAQKSLAMTGNMYEVDFGDARVYYRPWEGAGVAKAQRGLLRIEKDNWGGDSTSMDEILDVLRQMGLSLDPATETSMQLFYWKEMSDTLANRSDRNEPKWAPVLEAVKKNVKASMSEQEKIDAYKAAWALAIGADKVESARWMPKFQHQSIFAYKDDEDFTSGHPYWLRPDVTLADLHKHNTKVAASSLTYGGDATDALPIALSGQMLSAEERLRLLGKVAKGGASSGDDTIKGSSGTVFVTPGVGYDSGNEVIYHPRVLLRSSNYRFSFDGYGDISKIKDNAPWDPAQAFASAQEMCIKNSVAVMDDVAVLKFPNAVLRKKAIDAYKKHGITTLHGIPIEKIFVLDGTPSSEVKAVLDKMWDDAIAEEANSEAP